MNNLRRIADKNKLSGKPALIRYVGEFPMLRCDGKPDNRDGWFCAGWGHSRYGETQQAAYARWLAAATGLFDPALAHLRGEEYDMFERQRQRRTLPPTYLRRAGPYGGEFGRIITFADMPQTRWQRIKEWIYDRR